MFTSCQNIEVYHNQLKQRYNQVRNKYVAKVQTIDQNSSMYGLSLPFENLSQIGRTNQTIQPNLALSNNSTLSDPISIDNCSLAFELKQKRQMTDRVQQYQEETLLSRQSKYHNQNYSINVSQSTANKKKLTIEDIEACEALSLKDIQSTKSVGNETQHKNATISSCQKLKQLKDLDLNKDDSFGNPNNDQIQKVRIQTANQAFFDDQCEEEWGQDYQLSYSNNGSHLGYSTLFSKAKKSGKQLAPQGQLILSKQQKKNGKITDQIEEEYSLLQQQLNFNISVGSFPNLNGSNHQLSSNTSILRGKSFGNQVIGVKLKQKNNFYSWNKPIAQEQSLSNSASLSESQSIDQIIESDKKIKQQMLKLPFLQTIIQKNSELTYENNTQRTLTRRDSDEAYKSTGFSYKQKTFTDNYFDMMEAIRRISNLCMKKQQTDGVLVCTLQDLQHNINKSIGQFKREKGRFSHHKHLTFGTIQ